MSGNNSNDPALVPAAIDPAAAIDPTAAVAAPASSNVAIDQDAAIAAPANMGGISQISMSQADWEELLKLQAKYNGSHNVDEKDKPVKYIEFLNQVEGLVKNAKTQVTCFKEEEFGKFTMPTDVRDNYEGVPSKIERHGSVENGINISEDQNGNIVFANGPSDENNFTGVMFVERIGPDGKLMPNSKDMIFYKNGVVEAYEPSQNGGDSRLVQQFASKIKGIGSAASVADQVAAEVAAALSAPALGGGAAKVPDAPELSGAAAQHSASQAMSASALQQAELAKQAAALAASRSAGVPTSAAGAAPALAPVLGVRSPASVASLSSSQPGAAAQPGAPTAVAAPFVAVAATSSVAQPNSPSAPLTPAAKAALFATSAAARPDSPAVAASSPSSQPGAASALGLNTGLALDGAEPYRLSPQAQQRFAQLGAARKAATNPAVDLVAAKEGLHRTDVGVRTYEHAVNGLEGLDPNLAAKLQDRRARTDVDSTQPGSIAAASLPSSLNQPVGRGGYYDADDAVLLSLTVPSVAVKLPEGLHTAGGSIQAGGAAVIENYATMRAGLRDHEKRQLAPAATVVQSELELAIEARRQKTPVAAPNQSEQSSPALASVIAEQLTSATRNDSQVTPPDHDWSEEYPDVSDQSSEYSRTIRGALTAVGNALGFRGRVSSVNPAQLVAPSPTPVEQVQKVTKGPNGP